MASRYDHLSKEELLRLLEARDRRDATRFGLVWEADEIAREEAINSDFVALDLVPELSTPGDSWRNLIIEGDNFDALRYLRMAFAGQAKCIYIDPPYNTGNRDFVYNERFVDGDASLPGTCKACTSRKRDDTRTPTGRENITPVLLTTRQV